MRRGLRRKGGVRVTAEVAPGVFVDFDADGEAIGVEVLSVGLRVSGTYGAARRAHECWLRA